MRARALSVELNAVDTNLSALVADLADDQVSAEDNLNGLLQLSADLEGHSAAVAYRFSASKAYAHFSFSARCKICVFESFEV